MTNKGNNSPGCIEILAHLAAWVCGVVWSVYAIIAIAHSSNAQIVASCAGSHLYAAAIVLVVLTISGLEGSRRGRQASISDDNPWAALCAMFVSLGIFGWVCTEYRRCGGTRLDDNNVRRMVGIWVFTVGGVLAACVLGVILYGMFTWIRHRCRAGKSQLRLPLRDDEEDGGGATRPSGYSSLEEGTRAASNPVAVPRGSDEGGEVI